MPPQQEDWKEEFEKMSSSSHDYMIETKVIPLNIAIGMTTQLLSSQARALKERIEKEFENFNLCDWSGESEVYSEIERLKLDVLAAIESIEI